MAVTQPLQYAEQRRWATFRFTVVSRTPQLSERKETISDFIRMVGKRVEKVLIKYDGCIDKAPGEGVMEASGAPFGTENDAERPFSAGLPMLDEVVRKHKL